MGFRGAGVEVGVKEKLGNLLYSDVGRSALCPSVVLDLFFSGSNCAGSVWMYAWRCASISSTSSSGAGPNWEIPWRKISGKERSLGCVGVSLIRVALRQQPAPHW